MISSKTLPELVILGNKNSILLPEIEKDNNVYVKTFFDSYICIYRSKNIKISQINFTEDNTQM